MTIYRLDSPGATDRTIARLKDAIQRHRALATSHKSQAETLSAGAAQLGAMNSWNEELAQCELLMRALKGLQNG